ncbi:hypothetical protein T484DRAFT_1935610 [Baffinella frigidus]|nr:hypothetical protein T484DRAFT_1935610 [Cryptophyta sp. CCMP2293]
MLALSCHPKEEAKFSVVASRTRAGAERLRACSACPVLRWLSQSFWRCFRAAASINRFCSSHSSVEFRCVFPLAGPARGLLERPDPDGCCLAPTPTGSIPSARVSKLTAVSIPATTLPASLSSNFTFVPARTLPASLSSKLTAVPATTLPASLSLAPPPAKDSRSAGNLAAGNGTRMGGLDVPVAASAIASISPQSIASGACIFSRILQDSQRMARRPDLGSRASSFSHSW